MKKNSDKKTAAQAVVIKSKDKTSKAQPQASKAQASKPQASKTQASKLQTAAVKSSVPNRVAVPPAKSADAKTKGAAAPVQKSGPVRLASAPTPPPSAVSQPTPFPSASAAAPADSKTAATPPASKRTAGLGTAGAQFSVPDAEAFTRNMMRFMEEGSKAMASVLGRTNPVESIESIEPAIGEATSVSKLFAEVGQSWMSDPKRLAHAQGALVSGYVDLWNNAMRRVSGETVTPVASPQPGDNRFKDPDWSSNPYYDFWKQFYLVTSAWADDVLAKTEGLDERTKARAEFYVRQMMTAVSPSNNPLTNPEVMRETMQSNGQNLVAGIENFAKDLASSGKMLKISQTDTTAFEVGRNVATTPGKVVFQNDLIQLIQYTPTTDTVHEIPFVIVPPWINKFYILDLTAEKSYIKFVVDQGFTVFVVSWVNPDERLSHKTFEDYMHEGLLAATEAAKRECGTKRVNILGYCIGGTLLATTLAYLAAQNKVEDHFNSATFLVAQKDFTKAGDLKLFIDEDQLDEIEATMAKKGYLEGSSMATVFNMLRPRDLIWPYIVNNYMLGKKPFAFDLLYWNQDSTRMPAANHMFYLREFYHENKLSQGKMVLGGVKLDLGRVKLPVFELATREDHISPPKSVYTGARLFGGPIEFVLAGSGHIAGVVSPPGKTKYPYWTNKRPITDAKNATLEQWLEGAEEHKDSWWPHWSKWLSKYSGGKVKPRKPGAKLGVIEDAPGSYVKVKS
jgi:polyhydroxyalkanoate synthase subunit PhaC